METINGPSLSLKHRLVIGCSALCGTLPVLPVCLGWHALLVAVFAPAAPSLVLGLADRIGGAVGAVVSALLVQAWTYRLFHGPFVGRRPEERDLQNGTARPRPRPLFLDGTPADRSRPRVTGEQVLRN